MKHPAYSTLPKEKAMKLSEIVKPEDVAALVSATGATTEQVQKIAEVVAVTTANRLGVNLEIDEWT